MTNEQYYTVIQPYTDAMNLILTRLDILNHQAGDRDEPQPIHSITSRIKEKDSIEKKLRKKHSDGSVRDARALLKDIAGIRVICSFLDDIYTLADMLAGQDDIRLLEKKDYIIAPKSNGYRSLHLILEVPIFLSQSKQYMKVEVQFRTIAMDFWASLDHKLKYKKDVEEPERIAAQLKECADIISSVDERMQQIRDQIEMGKKEE